MLDDGYDGFVNELEPTARYCFVRHDRCGITRTSMVGVDMISGIFKTNEGYVMVLDGTIFEEMI